MPQTGYTPIQLYRSSTASAVPVAGNLNAGELAINTVDEKLYFKNNSNVVKQILTADGAQTVTNKTLDGTNGLGYMNIPQNSQSAAYTLVLADAGKHIYHPSADTTARTMTIPANASVAYPIGTALTFVNDTSAGVMTIAITSDTMILAGQGTTGSRTLAANGIATALKIAATRWIISGSGLT